MSIIDRRGIIVGESAPGVNDSPTMQIVTSSSAVIASGIALVVIERASPGLTLLTLPSQVNQGSQDLRIVDWSTAVTDHEIRLTPAGTDTIMKAATWSLFSNAAQLASATFHPSLTLAGWYTAP